MINTVWYTNKFIIFSSKDLHAHMKQNLCEWLKIKFDTLCYPKLHVEYIIYVAACWDPSISGHLQDVQCDQFALIIEMSFD